MANKDVTTARVKNVMNQMPKSIMEKRESKVRNTVRSTPVSYTHLTLPTNREV